MRSSTDNSGWSKGFWSGVFTMMILALVAVPLFNFVHWLRNQSQAQTIIDLLTKPLFSIVNIFEFLMFLLILWVVVYMLAFGPRR